MTYLLRQTFRYDYDGPAYDLRQRIVALPRERHGSFARVDHTFSSSVPGDAQVRTDRDGNTVLHFRLPEVASSVTFETAALVTRTGPAGPEPAPGDRYLQPTRLTRADGALRALAASLRSEAADDEEFAHLGCARVRAAVAYRHDATSVTTTAAEAYTLGVGVCQDSAHVLLALCRAAGVPARYVSGHLLGQAGGSHAWVEVLTGSGVVAVDPSNGCVAGPRHLPVAVGRDYLDVAPTSGSYSGTAAGWLTATKTAGVVSVSELPCPA